MGEYKEPGRGSYGAQRVKAKALWSHRAAKVINYTPLIINHTLWLTECKASNGKQLRQFHTPATKYNCLPLAFTLLNYLPDSILA